MVPIMPSDSWGMQINSYVPGLSNVKVSDSVDSESTSTSIPRPSTVKVWNSFWEVN